jgi:cell division protein FtsZ
MRVEFEDNEHQAKIKVVGVGGSGGNAVANMIAEQLAGVDFIAANTDMQALEANPAACKIQLGANLTKGLGAGGNPDVGRKAALEDVVRIQEVLQGADMVFIAAGMGGGTGTGAAPIVAQVARDVGALTVGVVTKPFQFEGKKRGRFAEEGILAMGEEVDTLITIPNQKLLSLGGVSLVVGEAFKMADDVLVNAVRGISDLITIRGDINVDFADVKTIMSNRGQALMGTGYAAGERRALDAAEMAISSPLLDDVSIDGAMGILINVTGGPDLTLKEISESVSLIEEAAHEDAHIIFGYVTLAEPCDEIKITVIATGFGGAEGARDRAARHVAQAPVSRQAFSPRAAERASRAPSCAPMQSQGRVSDAPEQVQIAVSRPSSAGTMRAQERDLDIPAFIRKHSDS